MSHTLSPTDKNYAQFEKECLAIVSCMEKWHHYLYGKHDIMVHSDHQPLETIFKKPLSRAPHRLERMMLRLQNYHFTVQYKKGKDLLMADTLSRVPLTDGSQVPLQNDTRVRCILRGPHTDGSLTKPCRTRYEETGKDPSLIDRKSVV